MDYAKGAAHTHPHSTVLGQVVSVSFGRVLIQELMQAAGPAARHRKTGEPISLFPSARQILEADISKVRTSEKRRTTIRSIAQAIQSGTLTLTSPHDLRALRKDALEHSGRRRLDN